MIDSKVGTTCTTFFNKTLDGATECAPLDAQIRLKAKEFTLADTET